VSQIQCFGQQNGAIDVTVLQGTPAYTYTWDNGATTEDLANLTIGTYRLTVTDINGCISYSSYTITQPTEILLGASVTNEVIGNDGSIDLTVAGGVPVYTIAWSNGVMTEDQINITAGSYDVTVFDANGCMNQLNVVVLANQTNGINENQAIEMSVYPNPSAGNATISWNTAVNELSITDEHGRVIAQHTVNGLSALTISALSSGTYFVRVLNEGGISATQRFVVL
jgi:hypothetical protein